MNWRATQDVDVPGGLLQRTPPRRPQSIRRTTTIQVRWPDGLGAPVSLIGRGRDIFTASPGARPALLALDELEISMSNDGKIAALTTTPTRDELISLVGHPAMRGFRGRLTELLEARKDNERPLGILLDDIPPASLISGWPLSLWPESPAFGLPSDPARRKMLEGVCIGHAPNSSAFTLEKDRSNAAAAPPIDDSNDIDAWHEIAPEDRIELRRARRIDLWRAEGLIHVDSMFQDSATAPDGRRRAIHEYGLRAVVDPCGFAVVELEAEPRILPYSECPGAAANVTRLIGTEAGKLRSRVLDELRGVGGCTHLNDALRALTSIPWLTGNLDSQP